MWKYCIYQTRNALNTIILDLYKAPLYSSHSQGNETDYPITRREHRQRRVTHPILNSNPMMGLRPE